MSVVPADLERVIAKRSAWLAKRWKRFGAEDLSQVGYEAAIANQDAPLGLRITIVKNAMVDHCALSRWRRASDVDEVNFLHLRERDVSDHDVRLDVRSVMDRVSKRTADILTAFAERFSLDDVMAVTGHKSKANASRALQRARNEAKAVLGPGYEDMERKARSRYTKHARREALAEEKTLGLPSSDRRRKANNWRSLMAEEPRSADRVA